MRKIRNINVPNNQIGTYAGPVESGRGGSRKSPECFSGASPPINAMLCFLSMIKRGSLEIVKEGLKNAGKTLRKGAAIAGVSANITAKAILKGAGTALKVGAAAGTAIALTGCPEVEIPPEEEVFIPLTISDLGTAPTQEQVFEGVNTALLQMYAQTRVLDNQYSFSNFATQGADRESAAGSVRSLQINLRASYTMSTQNDIMREEARWHIDRFFPVRPGGKQLSALRHAHRLRVDGSFSPALSSYNSDNYFIERDGGQRVPEGVTWDEAIQILESALMDHLPEQNFGPNRSNIIQQVSDFFKFDAWTNDLRLKGFRVNRTIPLSSSQSPTQTRGEIQAEQGLLV
jgi:hypothetical protein